MEEPGVLIALSRRRSRDRSPSGALVTWGAGRSGSCSAASSAATRPVVHGTQTGRRYDSAVIDPEMHGPREKLARAQEHMAAFAQGASQLPPIALTWNRNDLEPADEPDTFYLNFHGGRDRAGPRAAQPRAGRRGAEPSCIARLHRPGSSLHTRTRRSSRAGDSSSQSATRRQPSRPSSSIASRRYPSITSTRRRDRDRDHTRGRKDLALERDLTEEEVTCGGLERYLPRRHQDTRRAFTG